jgi:hypothetical protein
MTALEIRRYAMLARVREFGEVHKDLFPETSEGGQAFAAVGTAVAQLATHTRSKLSSTYDGRRARVAARTALRDRLDTIARTARAIAEKTPGFADPFRLPVKQADESLLITLPIFIDEAEAKKERLVRHGLSETFIEDLKSLIDQFAQAVRTVVAAKERSKVARKGIAAAQLAGVAAVRQLDVIVANQLEHDQQALAHWEEARKMEYLNRRRPATAEEEPVLEPVAPLLQPQPASASVSAPSSAATQSTSVMADSDAGVIQFPKAS